MSHRTLHFCFFGRLDFQLPHSGKHWYRSQFLPPGCRRWYKKQAVRKMRRWAKRDPENAPTKRAYSDDWW